VDFFWLDWQQEQTTSLPGVNPSWWLNYVHFTDMERRGKRPLIYHRWGGLGNHRYEIGFSGDVVSSWESLSFQPFFTATAANVGYGYWSHDIGGHLPGTVLPEMYTRWIQFGAFSPILRTHTTKNPAAERRIWAYPPEYAEVMRDTFYFRYALIPYIYTAARNTYDTGVSICHPLYYDYPEASEAYEFKDEYLFGDSLLVSPVTAPLDASSQLVRKTIWLPPGDWIEWYSGALLHGPARVERTFALREIPLYVKAGAILPMQPKMSHTGERPVDPLILAIYPGNSGSTRVYHDESDTLGYKEKAFAWTPVRHSRSADGAQKIEILPVEGSYSGMLTERGYQIRLPGSWPPESVFFNGRAVNYSHDGEAPSWTYNGDTLTTIISLPRVSVHDRVEVIVKTTPALEAESALLDGTRGRLARLRETMTILNGTWSKGWSPDNLIEAVQTGNRITINPSNALDELRKLRNSFPEILKSILALPVDSDTILRAMRHLDQPVTIVPAAVPAQPVTERR
jgi:alpha-glucosidase